MRTGRAPVGTREWHEQFRRSQQRFDRIWPYWRAACLAAIVIGIVLIIADVPPAWLLCLFCIR